MADIIYVILAALLCAVSSFITIWNARKGGKSTSTAEIIQMVCGMLPEISKLSEALTAPDSTTPEKREYVVNYITNIFSAMNVNIGHSEREELLDAIDKILSKENVDE